MKYAHYEKNTQKLLGFYSDDIHSSIPTPNIEISESVWQDALNKGFNKVNKDGTMELFDFRTDDEKVQQELQVKIAEAQAYLDKTDHKFYSDYEMKEGETQDDLDAIKTKRSEARAFIRTSL